MMRVMRCVVLGALCLVALLEAGIGEERQVPRAGKRFAFVVGVDKYADSVLAELKCAENEARVLGKVLEGYGYQVVVLTEELATRKAITDGLTATAEKAKGANDLLLVALSGRGVQFDGRDEAFFCPFDARLFKEKADTMVSMKCVFDGMKASFAGVEDPAD